MHLVCLNKVKITLSVTQTSLIMVKYSTALCSGGAAAAASRVKYTTSPFHAVSKDLNMIYYISIMIHNTIYYINKRIFY